MKLVRIGVAVFIFLSASIVSLGQSKHESVLFDEFDNGYCSEDLISRLDMYLLELSHRPTATGDLEQELSPPRSGR